MKQLLSGTGLFSLLQAFGAPQRLLCRWLSSSPRGSQVVPYHPHKRLGMNGRVDIHHSVWWTFGANLLNFPLWKEQRGCRASEGAGLAARCPVQHGVLKRNVPPGFEGYVRKGLFIFSPSAGTS